MPNPWRTMKPAKIRLFDIFTSWEQNEVSDLGVTVDGVQIFTNAQIFTEMSSKYWSWYWVTVEEGAADYFKDLWKAYITSTGKNLLRAYNALLEVYNPIENYNLIEESADGTKRDTDTLTKTPEGETKTTHETNKFAIDTSTDGEQSDKETTTTAFTDRTDTETQEHDNTITVDFQNESMGGYNEGHEHKLARHGNIGVQTAADIIGGELRLRTVNLLDEYVVTFMNTYCYYVGSEIYDDYSV